MAINRHSIYKIMNKVINLVKSYLIINHLYALGKNRKYLLHTWFFQANLRHFLSATNKT